MICVVISRESYYLKPGLTVNSAGGGPLRKRSFSGVTNAARDVL
jgi:hypothetical protein